MDTGEDTGANADQIVYWNSEQGEEWVALQTDLDVMFRPVLQELLARAAPGEGERVLDVGCGAGSSTLAFAARVGADGEAVGADVSAPLLERARRSMARAGVANVQFLLADAQTHAFEAERFDLLASRFGVMFFADPLAAFTNLAAALRRQGRVCFISWAELADNVWFRIPRDIAVARLGPPTPAPPTAPGPFAFSDAGRVLGILRDAGFAEPTVDRLEVTIPVPGTIEDASRLATNLGPATRIAKQYGADENDMTAITADIAGEFAAYAETGTVRIPATVNCFTARKS